MSQIKVGCCGFACPLCNDALRFRGLEGVK